MLTDEATTYLPKLKIKRSISDQLVPLPSGRLPRYRVFIPPDFKDLLVGCTLIGRYYVLSVKGCGGMSVVYRAKDLTRRNKVVAVKALRMSGLTDGLLIKRFQREAELLGKLNHPRIVQVHHFDYTTRGQPYFVMDYLTGETLANVIKREGSLDPDRVRHIFSQVCGAVHHAHRCGVIHRDLKPANVMLMEVEGQKDFAKVVDFGIARFEAEVQRLTRVGEVWGSPIYMSPEQCIGGQLDARSDVYSLGIMMYEALTGEVPFLGMNYVATMTMQINDLPKPFAAMRPDLVIPSYLEQIVNRALQKDPSMRFESVAVLREELENMFERRDQEPDTEEIAEINPKHSQQRLSQQRLSQQRLSQQRISQQKFSEDKLSQQKLSQQKLSQERVSQQKISQQKISSGRDSQRQSQQRISRSNDDRSGQRALTDRMSNQRTAYSQQGVYTDEYLPDVEDDPDSFERPRQDLRTVIGLALVVLVLVCLFAVAWGTAVKRPPGPPPVAD